MKTGSCFAGRGAAREAVQMALPMIEAAMRDAEVCGSGFLCIVVTDPALEPGDEAFATTVAANLRAIAKQRHAAACADRKLVADTPPSP